MLPGGVSYATFQTFQIHKMIKCVNVCRCVFLPLERSWGKRREEEKKKKSQGKCVRAGKTPGPMLWKHQELCGDDTRTQEEPLEQQPVSSGGASGFSYSSYL